MFNHDFDCVFYIYKLMLRFKIKSVICFNLLKISFSEEDRKSLM